jgi:hypothetical protein
VPCILTVVGARPQFIKAAPVSAALASAGSEEFLLHTGQHYDRALSEVFFEELGLRPPDLNLEVGSGTHGGQTAAMLTGIERAILEQKPDWLLLYGDTNSTLAGALAAAKLRVPVSHVEAGLRSFNRRMPEEINRVVADAVADLLFVPTDISAARACPRRALSRPAMSCTTPPCNSGRKRGGSRGFSRHWGWPREGTSWPRCIGQRTPTMRRASKPFWPDSAPSLANCRWYCHSIRAPAR